MYGTKNHEMSHETMWLYSVAGADETVVVTLKFSGNRMAVFTCSASMALPNDAIIVGTKGTIRVGLHAGWGG